MENYEELIISSCKGESPKEKYDWLLGELSKVQMAKTMLIGLNHTQDDVTLGTIRSFITANHEKINESKTAWQQ